MTHARITDGVVVELLDLGAAAPGDLFHPTLAALMLPCGGDVGLGWRWDGARFAPPAPPAVPVPAQIDRLQARLYLLAQPAPAGSAAPHLWGYLEAWALEPARSDVERAYWQDARTWRRDHALVAAIGADLGLSGAEIDAMFVAAAAL